MSLYMADAARTAGAGLDNALYAVLLAGAGGRCGAVLPGVARCAVLRFAVLLARHSSRCAAAARLDVTATRRRGSNVSRATLARHYMRHSLPTGRGAGRNGAAFTISALYCDYSSLHAYHYLHACFCLHLPTLFLFSQPCTRLHRARRAATQRIATSAFLHWPCLLLALGAFLLFFYSSSWFRTLLRILRCMLLLPRILHYCTLLLVPFCTDDCVAAARGKDVGCWRQAAGIFAAWCATGIRCAGPCLYPSLPSSSTYSPNSPALLPSLNAAPPDWLPFSFIS